MNTTSEPENTEEDLFWDGTYVRVPPGGWLPSRIDPAGDDRHQRDSSDQDDVSAQP